MEMWLVVISMYSPPAAETRVGEEYFVVFLAETAHLMDRINHPCAGLVIHHGHDFYFGIAGYDVFDFGQVRVSPPGKHSLFLGNLIFFDNLQQPFTEDTVADQKHGLVFLKK